MADLIWIERQRRDTSLMPNLRVVLFDIGGVLIELGGMSHILAWTDPHQSVEQLLQTWLASPAVRRFETGGCEASEFATELVREMSVPVSPDDFLAAFAAWPRGPIPGALELVERIPPNYIRATLSNTNALHWARLYDQLHMAGGFHHHFPSHLTGNCKPDAAAFAHVCKALGVHPSEVLFLDDAPVNVEGAQQFGMRAVHIRSLADTEAALKSAGVLQ